jgi:hypothetical protein
MGYNKNNGKKWKSYIESLVGQSGEVMTRISTQSTATTPNRRENASYESYSSSSTVQLSSNVALLSLQKYITAQLLSIWSCYPCIPITLYILN